VLTVGDRLDPRSLGSSGVVDVCRSNPVYI
jgi:hypothetical protein